MQKRCIIQLENKKNKYHFKIKLEPKSWFTLHNDIVVCISYITYVQVVVFKTKMCKYYSQKSRHHMQ